MIDPQHPRAKSLEIRDKIVTGVRDGITSLHGLIAQGRGEAFDYLIDERTHDFAMSSIEAASAMLLLAEYPVLSVNGNSAALCPKEYVILANVLSCPIEINLFHRTLQREKIIRQYLQKFGAKHIVGVGSDADFTVQGIASERRQVSSDGIKKADVVFVPLEDGDRTEALIELGKKVITVDLNPISRTAQKATITIVDNIVRALPLLIETILGMQKRKKDYLQKISNDYNNQSTIHSVMTYQRKHLLQEKKSKCG